MNTQEEQIFWELLQYSLFRTPMHPEKWTGTWNWQPIMQNLQAQSLETIASDAIMSLSTENRPAPKEVLRINQLIGMNMRQHLQLNSDLKTIFAYLKDNGLHPVLLKGQGNATYYPNPLLRMTGDLDIYVGKADYEKGCQLLRDFVHSPEAEAKAEESDKHYHIDYGNTIIELHRVAENLFNPIHNRRYEKMWSYWFQHPSTVHIGDADIQIPPKEFNALYVFNHLWHHFISSGVGLRQFCDLSLILHKDHAALNEDELRKNLQKLNLYKPWQMVGGVLVDHLGLPKAEFPLYSNHYGHQTDIMLKLVWEGGNFGCLQPFGSKKDAFFKRKFDSFKRWMNKIAALFPIAPTASLRIIFYLLKGGNR